MLLMLNFLFDFVFQIQYSPLEFFLQTVFKMIIQRVAWQNIPCVCLGGREKGPV